MNIVFPSKFLHDLLTTIWSEPSGRIFLLSVAYYLFSAFTVSGYMAYFAGGLGNIGFGDYSIIDFLFFLPTVAVTGLSVIYDNIKRALINIFVYLVLPNFGAIWLVSQLYKIPNLVNRIPQFFFTSVFLYGLLFAWLIGLNILLSINPKRLWIGALMQFISVLIFTVAAVAMVTKNIAPPTPRIDPTLSTLLTILSFGGNLFLIVAGLGTLFLFLLLVGRKIASEAIRYKYLSRIVSIELAEPLLAWENWRIQDQKKSNSCHLFRRPQIIPTVYQYEPQGNVLLVAALKRITAFYVPESDTTIREHGKLFLVSNNNIQSIELRSGKK